ncbi:MAG: class IV adenylate cyclase [Candidatus Saccharibacteria bacterium]|nr:class IV adenylate cyclase [Candidatus Saccharibacteria bacterium]
MTLLEIERKRDITGQLDTALAGLANHGFQETSELRETDTYYSRPDVDFMRTVECLRIRQRDGFAEITYKPASTAATHTGGDIIIKPETNLPIAVENVAVAQQLLTNLDMRELVVVAKLRRSFQSPAWPNVTIAIDDIAGAGLFIEIEVMSNDQAVAATMIHDIEELLNLIDFPVVTRPYRDICMECGDTKRQPSLFSNFRVLN